MPPQSSAPRPVTTMPALTWSRAFLAVPAQVREARRFLASILDGCPVTDDALLCVSELAANAVQHSNSRHGGHFTVRAEIRDRCLRVEVHDQGGLWTWRAPASDQHGRGLAIVSQLARDWGRTGTGSTGWIVWFAL